MDSPHDDAAEDAALARRIAEGDAAAEALLCRRLLPRVRAYGLRHLREDGAASDLAQHVVLIVLEALRGGRVADVDRIGAFVMGACRNTVLEWKRVDRRRGALLEKFGPTFMATVEVESVAVDRDKLVTCIEKLKARERAVLALSFFGDRDAADIAAELAISMGNVRVTRHRALGQLHDCITRGEPS
jgi:RNA polymerase sigma-70 factor, ECF subfamily